MFTYQQTTLFIVIGRMPLEGLDKVNNFATPKALVIFLGMFLVTTSKQLKNN
jgi:hypothetical protein